MRFFLVFTTSFSPKRLRRSTIEMILPRKLITPSTHSGASGTEVMSGTRTISCTSEIGTPNVSRPMRKPTICKSLAMVLPRVELVATLRRRVTSAIVSDVAATTVRAGTVAAHVDNEAVHHLQQGTRHLRHLFRRSRQLCRAGGRLLHQFAHLFHRADHGLSAGCLLFHGRVDLVRDLIQPRGSARDLRRAVRLFVRGRADLLRELVDLGHHV